MARSAAEAKAWLDQVAEEIVDPERPIVDAHHHMWRDRYELEDLWADTESGHNVVKTVFIECRSEYREDGPEHLRPVGETEFMTGIARASRGYGRAEISAIVAYTDLSQDPARVRAVCDAHRDASGGLFRGIRHGGAYEPGRTSLWGDPATQPDLYARQDFRKSVTLLGEMGVVYETWHYHHQNSSFAEVARAVPGTVMTLNHLGSPIGSASSAGQREEILAQWKRDMIQLAACENVRMKLGGLGMPTYHFGWHLRETPATSDEVANAQRDYYLHAIDCFGPDRCMFESNFPVDKLSMSYHVYWNAMKKIAAEFSERERDMLFAGTASRVYDL